MEVYQIYTNFVKFKYIIFDRDGTLIKYVPYINNPDLVQILPNVIEGMKLLSKLGFRFGIITNQSGICRGKFSIDTVLTINKKIMNMFESNQLYIDFVFFCPHAPENFCTCRKPEISLGVHAIQTFLIDVSLSYMIGDSDVDIKFGNAIGMKTIRIGNTNEKRYQSDYTTFDILAAAKLIENEKS